MTIRDKSLKSAMHDILEKEYFMLGVLKIVFSCKKLRRMCCYNTRCLVILSYNNWIFKIAYVKLRMYCARIENLTMLEYKDEKIEHGLRSYSCL